ncbi:MAG: tRNA (adenosine(37)-N6)-dimethylallyltransferase MiaA [Clostridiales bacterium]|nr:tRNA (adenosine(37)-N6)-dimethylallyltransferase MiaA [Clostridiales bacterium]
MVQENSIKYNCIIILGPTACGKTSISIELAKELNTEIISADSMQIYKDLNIGSAKVTQQEAQGIQHHMIDIIPSDATFSVSEYKILAEKIASRMIEESKIPIIAGGTGFYLTALIENNIYGLCEGDNSIRQKYIQIASEKGNIYVHNILNKIDPVSAQKLHPNDIKRVIRAIEIYEVTGKTKTELELENKKQISNSILHPLIIGLNLSTREKLYSKIDKRVDIMFEEGLLDEVKHLICDKGLTINNQSMQGIGYKEFFDYFSGNATIDETKSKICLNTRHYAKRQLTYFNKFNIEKWYNTDEISVDDIVLDICNMYFNKK